MLTNLALPKSRDLVLLALSGSRLKEDRCSDVLLFTFKVNLSRISVFLTRRKIKIDLIESSKNLPIHGQSWILDA